METLRLLKSYRRYRAGSVIQATPQLAAYLVQHEIAVIEQQRALPAMSQEHSVVTGARVETR